MNRIKETEYANFTWIDITNPRKDRLEQIANEYKLNYFQIVDSLEHGHLPKFERQPNYCFMILRAYTAPNDAKYSSVDELSNKIAFFYNEKEVITIHRANFDFLENITTKFQNPHQLMIFIINHMIQTFVEPASYHSTKIDDAEKLIFLKDSHISLEDIYFQKAQTRISKKLLLITQDVINKISVNPDSVIALQDVKDKIMGLILIYDEVAEDANNLINTYLSITARKNNDVMKLLTVFSAFFLPLTFIVGVYGMNFPNMPELKWHYGYVGSLIVMTAMCGLIYIWFKRKKIM